MSTEPQPRPGREALERENRVAAALRENLRKRKAQQEAKAKKDGEET